MRRSSPALRTLAGALLVGLLLPLAAAHGDEDMDMTMAEPTRPAIISSPEHTSSTPPSYFTHPEHRGLMFAHIALMTIAWVFVLPVGVFLSIARSRFSLLVQLAFLAVNAIGILLVTIYNASTPDLYLNNAHQKLGWVVTWIAVAQLVLGVIGFYAGRQEKRAPAYLPVSSEAMAAHHRWQGLRPPQAGRFSNDSGQGTERNTESLRSQSISSAAGDSQPSSPVGRPEEDGMVMEERHGLLRGTKIDRFLRKRIPGLLSSRVLRVGQFVFDVVDRVILLLGFAVLTSGIVTYGGLFKGSLIFSGLAHFIKGGVFFWYGILTLGRWAGSFAEIGWAWNIKPVAARNVRRPSAEFVESFLIFFYGSTNVFLEHLGRWGREWGASDFQHLSITIMFIGGGLCGMLIESIWIRELLNSTPSPPSLSYDAEEEKLLEPPMSYRFPMNPIPALVVLLLGIMMSSHHQESMISTMIHKQWGTLLLGASFARGATYVIFYLSPPTSVLPGRPPSELITAFCLISGGMLFMASAADCIAAMEHYGLDAMFIFTVSMGIVTSLMAWVIFVIAIKGLAVRKERSVNERHQYHIVS